MSISNNLFDYAFNKDSYQILKVYSSKVSKIEEPYAQ